MNIVVPYEGKWFLIYFYPNENSVGIYQVTGDISFYYKDGFKCVAGYV
jgi:hypothetical protein